MAQIALVTDSTAFIDREKIKKHKIEVVPLYVNFPDEVLEDGSIDNALFFKKLRSSPKLPFTSQPSPGDFVKVYERLVKEGKEIISIHISSGISGTVESANSAAKMVDPSRISVVDSLFTSGGLAMMVLNASSAIDEGKTREEIVELLEKMKRNTHILFVPNTLEYLKKGGRIGGAQALLGTLLNIKPVLYFSGGRVEVFDKVRTMKKALQRIVDELPSSAEGLQVGILTAETSPEHIRMILALIEERLPGMMVEKYELSPVIGTHAGPGVLGLAYMQHF
ncbi:MAG TPA: DegV family protein [Firmicutes bacterium]|jgi:DegV family protein with EDD domain|nr:DegV family protein [Bacillota bacterium]